MSGEILTCDDAGAFPFWRSLSRVFPIRQIPTNKLPKRFCLPHLKDHLQLNQPVTCAWNLTACKKHYKNTTFFGFLYFPYLLSCRHSSESFVGTFWELDSCWRPVSGPFWARVLGPYISNRGFWWVPLEPMSGWCSLAVRIISVIISAHSRPFFIYCQNSKSATSSHP